jgi:hypothetical protein
LGKLTDFFLPVVALRSTTHTTPARALSLRTPRPPVTPPARALGAPCPRARPEPRRTGLAIVCTVKPAQVCKRDGVAHTMKRRGERLRLTRVLEQAEEPREDQVQFGPRRPAPCKTHSIARLRFRAGKHDRTSSNDSERGKVLWASWWPVRRKSASSTRSARESCGVQTSSIGI